MSAKKDDGLDLIYGPECCVPLCYLGDSCGASLDYKGLDILGTQSATLYRHPDGSVWFSPDHNYNCEPRPVHTFGRSYEDMCRWFSKLAICPPYYMHEGKYYFSLSPASASCPYELWRAGEQAGRTEPPSAV